MASRAEPAALALTEPESADKVARPAPASTIGGAIRAAGKNAYYHSWRLLPANIVWAVVAIALAIAILVSPLGLVLVPVLALPTAGIFRITTRIARGQAVSFWDAVDAWRSDIVRTLALGAGITLAVAILGFNVASGLASASALGWAFATLAAWGLVATWLFAWTAWPIVVDPDRAHRSFAERLRLAALLVLAHPVRIGAFAIVVAVFIAVSAVAIVALVTISVAFAALVASELVLPAADRLETQLRAQREAQLGSGPRTPPASM
ncbi:MAG: hypothetical protein H0U52_00280 [Chloroflexi bacterium]|nr:hypothetical protein [Chloroflexota bacterium]